MYRILLLSDTHGGLDTINELAKKTKADFVIHAGDFGFYDSESVVRLSPRELRLLVTHSPFRNQYNVTNQTERDVLTKIVNEHNLLGDFPDYLSGAKQFDVPVYAVYGNHEDTRILKYMREGLSVPNLTVLDELNTVEFQKDNQLEFSLYGLGGNFLASKKLFDRPIAGRDGKVWSTLHQFGALYKKVNKKSKASIFVSHVSPGKEPLLTRLISNFMPNIWLSGHMGAPFTCVWNQFTIRELNESIEWLNVNMDFIEEEFKAGHLTEEAMLAYEVLQRPVPKADYWFKKMWNINLPDAGDGHAILIFDEGRFSLETYSRGVKPVR